MGDNTEIALSIRQPWAWLIVNGYKDIENRDWPTRYRGPVLIHAGKTMTNDDYDDAAYHAFKLGLDVPDRSDLERGGVVGRAIITDCVDASDSPWFFGRYGFVLAKQEKLPFMPLKGQLGFFKVTFQWSDQ